MIGKPDINCGNCQYFDSLRNVSADCRYNPPSIGQPRWPSVLATDWCAKFYPSTETISKVVARGIENADDFDTKGNV